MSFHHSADIPSLRLNDQRLLIGRLRDNAGSFQGAAIDLNTCLSNNQGQFFLGGEGYIRSCSDVTVGMEGGGNAPVLRAQLKTPSGAWLSANVNLAERIKNINGHFVFE